jgi:F-type H+-transporting ATPase subunit b
VLIDWFTVVAQVINFLILAWLLKHFLYQPILDAIDAREKRIAAELADADVKKAEATQERDAFRHKNDEFDRQRAALLSQATDDAKAERQRLMDEARQVAEALSAKRMETLRNDAHNLNQAISRRTQQEVFAIARKALTDLASTSLEERLGEMFTRRLRELDARAKDDLASALNTASAPVLISGIELTTNGQKVAWSIADYLASLEKSVGELLMEPSKPKIKPETRTKSGAKPAAPAETK